MVYLKEKKIGDKKYFYLTKSVRLPNGTVKTIQKLVKKNEPKNRHSEWFEEAEKKAFRNWAVKSFGESEVFTKEQLEKIESARLDYKKILKNLSKRQLKDLFDRFTVNFTYESNAIEGNSLTLKDVAIVLFDKLIVKGKDLREIYETINSRKVVDLILKKKFDVNEKNIIQMHRMLVKNMEIPPGYKKVPNYLVGRKVETTAPEDVPKEMEKLIEYYQTNRKKMHPIQLAAHLHGLFEKIHPFEDGNGRVGRFLINVMLVNEGYPPLIIRKTQRIAYYKCLEDFDNGYKKNLERFLMEKYKNTYKKFFQVYVKYAK